MFLLSVGMVYFRKHYANRGRFAAVQKREKRRDMSKEAPVPKIALFV